MAAPYNLIEEKVEDAFSSMLGTAVTGATKIKGLVEDPGVFPALVIMADNARSAMDADPNGGNWIVDVKLSVLTEMNDSTRAAHSMIVGLLRDKIMTDDLIANLNAAGVTEFVADAWTLGPCQRGMQDGMRATTTQGELWCRTA